MAKNINTTTEGRTLEVIRAELEAKVDQYNLTSDAVERSGLRDDMKKLTNEWNEGSLLTVYAKCMDQENPLLAFGVEYHYPTINTKDQPFINMVDGVKTTVFTCIIEEGLKQMSLSKFLAWAKSGNHHITAAKNWADQYSAAHVEAKAQWSRFFAAKGETTEMKIGQMKRKLQALFDSLVFIAAEGGSDKNALVATGGHAKYILGLANVRKTDVKTKAQKIQSMSTQTWDQLITDVWHQVCAKKSYDVVIGDEEPKDDKATGKKSGKAEAKTDTSAKDTTK